MKFSQILANAFARRIAYVIVALLLAWLGLGKANAGTYPDQGSAYSACKSHEMPGHESERAGPNICTLDPYLSNPTFPRYMCTFPTNYGAGEVGCWGESEYIFPIAQTCSQRPDGQAGLINGTQFSGGVCSNGCKMVANTDNPTEDFTTWESGTSINFKRGTWVATGGTCVVDPQTPQQPPEQKQGCHTTSSGHVVCRGEGKTCVTAPSGFKTCASDPNSSGTVKTNNPRTESTSISAPNTPPNLPTNRPGETWVPSGPASSVVNNITNNTTNIQNGSNATPNGNEPVPGDGAGGEEGEEEEPGSVGGGGDCATPFTCSGGDPILCGVGQQVWLDRCANDANNDGQPDWTAVEGDGSEGAGEEPEGMPHKEDVRLGVGMLDEGGLLGGGACPTFGTVTNSFGTFDLDEQGNWCDLLQLANGFFKLLGGFIALRILMT